MVVVALEVGGGASNQCGCANKGIKHGRNWPFGIDDIFIVVVPEVVGGGGAKTTLLTN